MEEALTSAVDIALTFFNKRDANPAITPEDAVAEVVMSPQHAKALMLVLQQNIVDYEKIFSTINLEPNREAFEEVQAKAQDQAKARAQAMEELRKQVSL